MADARIHNNDLDIHAGGTDAQVANAVQALNTKYHLNLRLVNENIQALKSFKDRIDTFKQTLEQGGPTLLECEAAKRFIDRIDTNAPGYYRTDEEISKLLYYYNGGSMTGRELFALIWHAMHDQNAMQTQQNIKDTERNLIKMFYEIQRAYNIKDNGETESTLRSCINQHALACAITRDQPSCKGGTFNRLVMSLSNLHPDVTISYVTDTTFTFTLEGAIRSFLREKHNALRNNVNSAQAGATQELENFENFLMDLEQKDQSGDRLKFACLRFPQLQSEVEQQLFAEYAHLLEHGSKSVSQRVKEYFANPLAPPITDGFFKVYLEDALKKLAAAVQSTARTNDTGNFIGSIEALSRSIQRNMTVILDGNGAMIACKLLEEIQKILGDPSLRVTPAFSTWFEKFFTLSKKNRWGITQELDDLLRPLITRELTNLENAINNPQPSGAHLVPLARALHTDLQTDLQNPQNESEIYKAGSLSLAIEALQKTTSLLNDASPNLTEYANLATRFQQKFPTTEKKYVKEERSCGLKAAGIIVGLLGLAIVASAIYLAVVTFCPIATPIVLVGAKLTLTAISAAAAQAITTLSGFTGLMVCALGVSMYHTAPNYKSIDVPKENPLSFATSFSNLWNEAKKPREIVQDAGQGQRPRLRTLSG